MTADPQTERETDRQAAPSVDRLRQVLREVFGFGGFRPHQEAIVRAQLAGRDAFVVMPTGGGKSLCYQLPACLQPGVCLVISPLIALMKDQVDAAIATGLRAAALHSGLAGGERGAVIRRLLAGDLQLLYVSPERFAMPEFVETLQRVRLAAVAVDEAHCISEWGHDFRPDYLNLANLVTLFPQAPVAAFTATATARVQSDIVARLRLRDPLMVRASFNRPNLFYQVLPKRDVTAQVLAFVRARPGESGIIYRTTRKSVEATAAQLAERGVRALPYHAGLADEVRAANQEAFRRDEAEVIVATIAFGMGIDKSNVRYVLHADAPKNIESYYQETGRAGRDGDPARCVFLFGYGDIPKIRHFLDQIEDPAERATALRGLKSVVQYATAHACRRAQLLRYFDETYPEADCGACDVCAGEVALVDATRDAQIVLSAIARTGERFGIQHVVDVVTGADSERLRRYGHDRIKTFGAGRDQDKRHWRLLIDNLLAKGLIVQRPGDYPVLALEPAARGVLFEGVTVQVLQAPPQLKARKSRTTAGAASMEGGGDPALFDKLRALRKRLAVEQGVPPYIVFSDRTLHEMARVQPRDLDALGGIGGVGVTKLARYGEPFLAEIQAHHAGAPPLP